MDKEAFSEFLMAFQRGELTPSKKGKQFFGLEHQKAAREKAVVAKKLSLLEGILEEFLSTGEKIFPKEGEARGILQRKGNKESRKDTR